MTLIYAFDLTGGGPLDGSHQIVTAVPAEGDEILHEGHSYCFSLDECRFQYKGRWRQFDLGAHRIIYRTFGEALRQLGRLQFCGAITPGESLDLQARIKAELRPISIDSQD